MLRQGRLPIASRRHRARRLQLVAASGRTGRIGGGAKRIV
mgnify:CR=1 FL=1